MNVAAQLDLHARSDPAALALVDDPSGLRWSWAQLRRDVAGAQRGLAARGLRAGDRVGLLLDNRPEFAILFLAAVRGGVVPVLLNTRWSAAELRLALEDSGARMLVCERRLVEQVGAPAVEGLACELVVETGDLLLDALDPIPPTLQRADDDLAEIMYTSGSSGRPKGVLHHHGHHLANAASLIDHFELRRQDVGLVPFPLFHQSGQTIWSLALALGGPLVIVRRWRAEQFPRLLRKHGVTYVHLITTAVTDLAGEAGAPRGAVADAREGGSSLRLTLFGGGSAGVEQAAAYERRFGGVLCAGYGRSEGGYSWEPPDRARRRFDRNGIPLRGTAELRIVDPLTDAPLPPGAVGEIRMRGDAVARGYWRRPDLDAAAFDGDGFMRTGDLGVLDDDGFLTFEGRADGMVKSGGENVYPSEVERVLLRQPAVVAAAVVGLPDARLGQRVAAAVVVREPHEIEAALDAWCRAELSGYKRPRAFAICEQLPLLGSGKVDYGAVMELFVEATARGGRR
ncbi:class I adenylate-forming enzyme family protein [Conexibacter sp. CPCC 206217]|uniref:class I adenylate-forming enzyme family protein n=1 Tax=Conexibacter sp. CPCC 206217 TaxID=3064574 RepID=UPI00271740C5|nr:class I adenylate-forming enzyme family protein [Conexibacter sp. CPCC 206217]MDO8211094.1 class I adenylate-forming enzyme family protein [Conexibacter sp. CPCC 206217]